MQSASLWFRWCFTKVSVFETVAEIHVVSLQAHPLTLSKCAFRLWMCSLVWVLVCCYMNTLKLSWALLKLPCHVCWLGLCPRCFTQPPSWLLLHLLYINCKVMTIFDCNYCNFPWILSYPEMQFLTKRLGKQSSHQWITLMKRFIAPCLLVPAFQAKLDNSAEHLISSIPKHVSRHPPCLSLNSAHDAAWCQSCYRQVMIFTQVLLCRIDCVSLLCNIACNLKIMTGWSLCWMSYYSSEACGGFTGVSASGERTLASEPLTVSDALLAAGLTSFASGMDKLRLLGRFQLSWSWSRIKQFLQLAKKSLKYGSSPSLQDYAAMWAVIVLYKPSHSYAGSYL